ncbi:MAG: polyketide cyclase [Candidatus Dadabacteria bacterium]|nr:polyketide cyclase [Candidatus Dadabacteria bacterium]
MSRYIFVSNWEFNVRVDKIWDELTHPEYWPEWWKYVKTAEKIKSGDKNGVGEIWRYDWSSRLPYNLCFEMETIKINEPYYIEGLAKGDLSGSGKWLLSETSNITNVKYEWNVETNKYWMKILSPFAASLFKWNHDEVMKAGHSGLKQYLTGKNS